MPDTQTGITPPSTTTLESRTASSPEFAWYSIRFAMITLFLDVVAAYVSYGNGDYAFAVGSGFIMGQVCLLIMASALVGNNWTAGYLSACIAIATIFVAMLFGTGLAAYAVSNSPSQNWLPPADTMALILVFPGAIFAAMTPMWVARSWLGWRLVRDGKSYPQFRSTLGGLFVNMVVMAGLFLTLRAPQVIWGYSPLVYWSSCAILGLTMSIVWAGFTVPMARVINVPSVLLQLAYLLGMACIIWTGVSTLKLHMPRMKTSKRSFVSWWAPKRSKK